MTLFAIVVLVTVMVTLSQARLYLSTNLYQYTVFIVACQYQPQFTRKQFCTIDSICAQSLSFVGVFGSVRLVEVVS